MQHEASENVKIRASNFTLYMSRKEPGFKNKDGKHSSTLTLGLARFKLNLVCSMKYFIMVKVLHSVACCSTPLYHFIFYFAFDVILANPPRPSERITRLGKISLSRLTTHGRFFHSCVACFFICCRGLSTPFPLNFLFL